MRIPGKIGQPKYGYLRETEKRYDGQDQRMLNNNIVHVLRGLIYIPYGGIANECVADDCDCEAQVGITR